MSDISEQADDATHPGSSAGDGDAGRSRTSPVIISAAMARRVFASLCEQDHVSSAQHREAQDRQQYMSGNDGPPREVQDSGSPRPANVAGYEITRVLGEGAGGIVYEAMRPESHASLALKLLRKKLGAGPAADRAWRELALLAQLRLPCVTRVHDYGTYDGRLYIVTEFVAGDALLDHCEKRQLTLRERVALLTSVCDCCQSLHEHGVIHRDIKPSNIIINPHGQPMIIDLGIATLLDDDVLETLTAEGQPIGSPAFMSPEQARGERTMLSTRSDVFSLGATCYRVLTGELPHDMEASMHEAIRRVAQDEPRDPRDLARDLPSPLAAVLRKAVSLRPDDRYESAAALAADLRRWLSGEPVEAGRPGVVRSVSAWLFVRYPLAGVCVLLVAIALGAAVIPVIRTFDRPVFPKKIVLSAQSEHVSLVATDYPLAGLGEWIAPVGDINGDGVDDIAIAAPALPNRSVTPWLSQAGGVLLVSGTSTALHTSGVYNTAFLVDGGDAVWLVGTSANANCGRTFHIGDVDGDGIDDLAVVSREGATHADPRSVLTIYLGERQLFNTGQGPRSYLRVEWGNEADVFGSWITWLPPSSRGSLRIAISAPRAKDRRGELFVVELPRVIDPNKAVWTEAYLRSQSLVLVGSSPGDEFGRFVDFGGDFDSDGNPDLLISSPCRGNARTTGVVHIVRDLTQLELECGTTVAADELDSVLIEGEGPSDWFGVMARWCGDFNGDGFDDIVVGAPQAARAEGDGGLAYVIGGSDSVQSVDTRTSERVLLKMAAPSAPLGAGDHLGLQVEALGDLNGDGYVDIAIAAPRANTPSHDAGCVYVVFGRADPRSITDVSAESRDGLLVMKGAAAGDQCGTFIAAADLDHNGKKELFVGAPGVDGLGRTDTGAAFVTLFPR